MCFHKGGENFDSMVVLRSHMNRAGLTCASRHALPDVRGQGDRAAMVADKKRAWMDRYFLSVHAESKGRGKGARAKAIVNDQKREWIDRIFEPKKRPIYD